MKQIKRFLLVLAFAVTACAPITMPPAPTPLLEAPPTPSPPVDAPPGVADDLAGTQWMLVSHGTPGAEMPVIEGSEVTLAFQEDGQAGGSGGCNSYGGPYVVEDGLLSFGEVVSTLVACVDEQVMEQEQQYFQALQTAGQYELGADQLTIYYDGGQGVLNFVASPAPA